MAGCVDSGRVKERIFVGLLCAIIIAAFVTLPLVLFGLRVKRCETLQYDCLLVNASRHSNSTFIKDGCSQGIPLTRDVWVHVCLYKGEVVVDIRHFINDRPQIKGVGLKKEQWYELIKHQNTIRHLVRDTDFNYTIFSFMDWL